MHHNVLVNARAFVMLARMLFCKMPHSEVTKLGSTHGSTSGFIITHERRREQTGKLKLYIQVSQAMRNLHSHFEIKKSKKSCSQNFTKLRFQVDGLILTLQGRILCRPLGCISYSFNSTLYVTEWGLLCISYSSHISVLRN